MKTKRRNRKTFSEHSYWQSYSDMMAALLLIFVLIIAITLAIYKQKTMDLEQTRLDLSAAQSQLDATRMDLEQSYADLEQTNTELAASLAELQNAYAQAAITQEELNKAYQEIVSGKQELANAKLELANTKSELQDIVGIRTDIIGALQSTFKNSSMTVDAQTGSITFSSDVLFRYNSATLTAESKQTLQEIIPMYLKVLLQDEYREYIAEIIVEGHTDTDGGYMGNMELSYNRANAVATFCLNEKNGLDKTKIEQLQQLLTVNGKSCSDPIYKTNGEVDMSASRRVEIKFRLKEDEMIEKIAGILAQE